MASAIATSAGTRRASPGIAVEIKEIALSGQKSFVPTAEEASQNQSEHRFLSLAPKTSAGYPVAGSKLPAAYETGEKGLSGGNGLAKGLSHVHGDSDAHAHPNRVLGKAARSESISSEASNSSTSSVGTPKGMSSKRFLKLGPVHSGEAGLGDWSEEVVE